MKQVELYTKSGNFIINVLIPPFLPGLNPDVLIWGERFFQKESERIYIECFAIVTFTKEEWEKMLKGII